MEFFVLDFVFEVEHSPNGSGRVHVKTICVKKVLDLNVNTASLDLRLNERANPRLEAKRRS